MRRIVLSLALALCSAAAFASELDAESAKDRYLQSFEKCRYEGGEAGTPACEEMAEAREILERSGYCQSGVGASFE